MKFKFMDRVEVIGGFYEGQKGEIENCVSLGLGRYEYTVNLDHVSHNKLVWILEKYLKKEIQTQIDRSGDPAR